ncbi:MAG: MFS transporter [Rhodopirellula sp.]|nr:MFS transporter [Rhodopirellula sp.]
MASPSRGAGKWWVCGLLLLALMLNYMDRQTLSLTIVPISKELGLTNTQYGQLEKGFAYGFAFGGILAGWLADRFSVRWMYPLVLLGWSAAGIASGYGDHIGQTLAPLVASWWPGSVDPSSPNSSAFLGFLILRTALGFFESGQWPCALITTQRLLDPSDRPFGNGVLQSGASLGAILTPLMVQALVTDQPGTWRLPFVVIGALGLLWILPWTWLVSGVSLQRPAQELATSGSEMPPTPVRRGLLVRRMLALVAVVVAINLTWHFFRAWLPKMLEEYHGYRPAAVRYFTAAYYIATDLGCITAGLAVKLLTARRMSVHAARLTTFFACALLTALSTVASLLDHGPLLLLMLLLIGFGSLGLFPNYYSLTQEISRRHQGKITGALGFITWVATAEMQQLVGQYVDRTQSYAAGIFWAGLAPAVAFLALCLLWGRDDALGGKGACLQKE